MAKWTAAPAGDDNIRVTIVEEAIDLDVVENYGNLRRFWSDLGVILNQVEQSQA